MFRLGKKNKLLKSELAARIDVFLRYQSNKNLFSHFKLIPKVLYVFIRPFETATSATYFMITFSSTFKLSYTIPIRMSIILFSAAKVDFIATLKRI